MAAVSSIRTRTHHTRWSELPLPNLLGDNCMDRLMEVDRAKPLVGGHCRRATLVSKSHECVLWCFDEGDAQFSLYLSASDGSKLFNTF